MDHVLTDRAAVVAQDVAWIERVRQGDEAALNALVAKHRGRVLRVAANLLRDRMEAEDVAQEAFLKSFRELHRLRDDRAYSGFIYRIAVRLCYDRLRSRKPTGEMPEQGEDRLGNAVETKVVVEKLLDRLPPDLRLTLVLREIEQLSYDEVAEVMACPVGTVRSRLHAARERFRDMWTEAERG